MSDRFPHIPLANAQPDASRFIAAIMGRQAAPRPPLVEYLIDDTLRRPIITNLLGRQWVDADWDDPAAMAAYWDNFAAFWHGMGYDYVRYEQSLPLSEHGIAAADNTASSGQRQWRDLHHGTITSWKDFESFTWPEVTPAFFCHYEYLSAHLPEGMGLVACHSGGIYEHLSGVMSYEGLCLALYDQPDLVAAVAHKLGETMLRVYEQLVELDGLVAIWPGDDMGFNTSTLLPPAALRQYTLPWHQRYAALAHAHGLPYFLHSCGNLTAIMDDLIDTVGIDAKHSYEDAIMPVEAFQARYGGRIGVLGGVDVDILTRRSEATIRERVRTLIETCHPRGRYAIGSGNSIPSYIPVENYLTMVDEAMR
jgi:uroporphyrinogen decarboxylase